MCQIYEIKLQFTPILLKIIEGKLVFCPKQSFVSQWLNLIIRAKNKFLPSGMVVFAFLQPLVPKDTQKMILSAKKRERCYNQHNKPNESFKHASSIRPKNE